MNPIELLKEHCEFNSPYDCYVLLAVSRKKDTPSITNSQEIVFREVIKNESDIVRKYNKIKASITNYKDEEGKSFPFYIYISLNARDSIKAVFSLRAKMDDWLRQTIDGVDCSRMFKKTYGHFYSELMRKECRSKHTKYFMIDYDSKDNKHKFKYILENNNIEIVLINETKNGYHFKIKPFDIRLLEDMEWEEDYKIERPDFELKKDANFFVEYVENEM